MNFFVKYKITLLILLFLGILENQAQSIRNWEAETSAAANIVGLELLKSSETMVYNKMRDLNKRVRNELIRYYGLPTIFRSAYSISDQINLIRYKVNRVKTQNLALPLFFNRDKSKIKNKCALQLRYLTSLDTDLRLSVSDNGNTLKTTFEIISELLKLEKEIDDTLLELKKKQLFFNLF